MDPGVLGQLQNELTLEATPGSVVDILEHGGLLEVGLLQAAFETVLLALEMFLFDEQCEALFEGELIIVGRGELNFKRLAEGSKFESLRGGKAPSHSPTRSPRFDRPRDPQASQQLHRRRFYAKEGGRPARPVARKAPLKCQ